jgi:hypothetical protein
MNMTRGILAGLLLAVTGSVWAQATRPACGAPSTTKAARRSPWSASWKAVGSHRQGGEDHRPGQGQRGVRQVQRRPQGPAHRRHDHHARRQAGRDDKGLWDGGEILDPKNGKVYKVRLKPIDGGKKLEVRGYIGAPLFGRTQTWIRVE